MRRNSLVSSIFYRVLNFLFSYKTSMIYLGIFAIAVAVATFIENDFSTRAARQLVYDALWFELLLALIVISIVWNIFDRDISPRQTFTVFIFHLSFILILIGAGITRYFSNEGIMHIREGQTTNRYITTNAYMNIDAIFPNDTIQKEQKVTFSTFSEQSYNKSIQADGREIHFQSTRFVPNAMLYTSKSVKGHPVLEMMMVIDGKGGTEFFNHKEVKTIGSFTVSFDDTLTEADLYILTRKDGLMLKSPHGVKMVNKDNWSEEQLGKSTLNPFHKKRLYKIRDIQIVLKKYLPKGQIKGKVADKGEESADALFVKATSGDETMDLLLIGGLRTTGLKTTFHLNGIKASIRYGSKKKRLPFSLKLEDFIMKEYPATNSPSSFRSELVLLDPEKEIRRPVSIFMNNILTHRGYRFYQTSYDTDQKGTFLTVNYDVPGTPITYAGYILVVLGMFSSLFNKKSRFVKLIRSAPKKTYKATGKIGASFILLFFIIFFPGNILAQSQNDADSDELVIKYEHARSAGKLFVQGKKGRIKPVSTLSSELLRKISRQSSYKGMHSDQVLISMMAYPQQWKKEPIIKIGHSYMKELLKVSGSHTTFNKFFHGPDQKYVLSDYVNNAYQKKPAARNKFDNEVVKVHERVHLCNIIFNKKILQIFPVPGKKQQEWINPSQVHAKLEGQDSLYATNIISLYLHSLNKANKSGNWEEANVYLNSMKDFQEKYAGDVLPSKKELELEIWYYDLQIFQKLFKVYGLIGLVLLLVQFFQVLTGRMSLKNLWKIAFYVVLILFIAHTAGLAMRWVISGHAPWSNGYEALTYISWATILAGLIFSSKSDVALTATLILSSLILHVAHLSWMDPEITQLVPVLKSYWLVIHVAVITASYSFLGMGAVMALINLILMNFRTDKNSIRIQNKTTEIARIIEISIIIGLYLLVTGTMLGAVWANQSWGRYWAWDPKETWALITILVYSVILHLRVVPGMINNYALNLLSLVGFGSVIMTYFGVNYYLSGMHSYAKGDPLPIPPFLYYALVILVMLAIFSYLNYKKLRKYSASSD